MQPAESNHATDIARVEILPHDLLQRCGRASGGQSVPGSTAGGGGCCDHDGACKGIRQSMTPSFLLTFLHQRRDEPPNRLPITQPILSASREGISAELRWWVQ